MAKTEGFGAKLAGIVPHCWWLLATQLPSWSGVAGESLSIGTFSRLPPQQLEDDMTIYRVVFETDALPLIIGDYKSIDEAYDVAVQMAKDFQKSGLTSLNQFRVVSKD